jgi:hypothetical protein
MNREFNVPITEGTLGAMRQAERELLRLSSAIGACCATNGLDGEQISPLRMLINTFVDKYRDLASSSSPYPPLVSSRCPMIGARVPLRSFLASVCRIGSVPCGSRYEGAFIDYEEFSAPSQQPLLLRYIWIALTTSAAHY